MILRAFLLSVTVASAAPVSFRAEIAPLLQRRCGTCHSADNPKGHYQIDTFSRLTKAGQSDLPPVTPGKPAQSELSALLRETSADDRMPQKADALPEAEIALIERWITEGAHFDGLSPSQPLVEMMRSTMLRAAPAKYPRALPITALAFSPDGQRLAVGGYYEVLILNAATGQLITRLGGLPERITSVAWHPRLPTLAVAGGSAMQWGTVALVDVAGLAPTRFLCDLPETVLSVAFNPSGSRIAAGCGDRTVRLFDAVTGASRRVLRLHADWVQTVSFSADGTHLLTASRDRTARIVDVKSGEVNTSYTGHDTPLLAAAFSPDGSHAWSLARGGALHRWDVKAGAGKGGAVGTDFLSFAAAGEGIVGVCTDHKMRFVAESDRKVRAAWEAPVEAVQSYAVRPDGKAVACGSADGTVALFELPAGKPVRTFSALPR